MVSTAPIEMPFVGRQSREYEDERAEAPVVLLAMRNAAQRHSLAFRLRFEGYEVLEVDSPWLFLDHLASFALGESDPQRPALVIADIGMPGLSAFDALDSLGQNRRGPTLFCVTPSLERELIHRARSIGAHAIFRLPGEDDALVSACTALAPVP